MANELDPAVKTALVTIATADSPMRFVGKGDYAAVFSKNDKAAKAVVEKCLAVGNPLGVEIGTARKLKVELTAAGVLGVLGDIPEEKAAKWVGIVAEKQPLDERMIFIRTVSEKIPLPDSMIHELLTKPREEKQRAEQEAHQKKLERVESEARQRQTQKRVMEENRLWEEATQLQWKLEEEHLLAELRERGLRPATDEACAAAGYPPPPLILPPDLFGSPKNDEENGYRRNYVRALAMIWYQNAIKCRQEAAAALQGVLMNVGQVKKIEETGVKTEFDPQYHECKSGCRSGAAVRVLHSGWMLNEPDGEHVVRKAIVEVLT